jgi:hypothetical protein
MACRLSTTSIVIPFYKNFLCNRPLFGRVRVGPLRRGGCDRTYRRLELPGPVRGGLRPGSPAGATQNARLDAPPYAMMGLIDLWRDLGASSTYNRRKRPAGHLPRPPPNQERDVWLWLLEGLSVIVPAGMMNEVSLTDWTLSSPERRAPTRVPPIPSRRPAMQRD